MTNKSTDTVQFFPLRIDILGKPRNIEIPFAALLLFILLLVFFFQVVFEGKILLPLDIMNTMYLPYAEGKTADVHNHFINDALTHYYPVALMTREAWQTGDLSLWNPYIFGGFPQFANSCFVQFSPLNLILTWGDMPGAYHRLLLTELWIAGFGFFLMLRRFKIPFWIALLFGAVYMLNGKFITNLHFRYMVSAFCWAPFIILMLDKATQERKVWQYLTVSAVTALAFLGSSLQTAVFIVILFAVFYYFKSLSFEKPSFKSLIVIPAAIGIVAVLLSLVAWVPYLEFFLLDESNRVATNAKHYSIVQRLLSLPFLITLPFPDLLGNPRALDASKLLGTTLDEFSAFIGFLPFCFSVTAAFCLWKDSRVRPFIILMALGLALPILTPLYKLLYHRFWMIFVFGALSAAAFYLTRALEGYWDRNQLRNHLKISLLGVIGVVLLQFIIGIGILFKKDELLKRVEELLQASLKSNIAAQGNEAWFISRAEKVMQHFSLTSFDLWAPLFLAAFSLAMWALWVHRKWNPVASFGGIFFAVILSLWLYDFSWLPVSDPKINPLFPETAETRFLKSDTTDYRVMILPTAGKRWIFYPNYLAAYGIATIDGNTNMAPRTAGWLSGKKDDAEPLALLNVKYLLTHKERAVKDTNFVKCFEGAISIYLNKRWHGGAYLSTVAALQKPGERRFSRDTVFFEPVSGNLQPAIPFSNDGDGNQVDDSLKLLSRSEFNLINLKRNKNEILVHFQTDTEGWLVLPNTDYTGWHAIKGNEEVPLYRVNYAMQAVYVTKGESELRLLYQPLSHKIAKWVSVISGAFVMLIIVITFVIDKRNRKINEAV